MPNAVNKPVNTYVFPELPQYKKEWIPVLEVVKNLIEGNEARFVCTALSAATHVRGPHHERAEWARLIKSIRGAITDSLGEYMTVNAWHRFTFNRAISRHRLLSRQAKAAKDYRLAWIDYIIMKCKDE